MQDIAFLSWRNERDAVEAEMNVLLQAGLTISPEDRRVRAMRFIALVERRDAAARDLLEAARQHVRLLSRTPRASISTRKKELLHATKEAQVSLKDRGSQDGAQLIEQGVEYFSDVEGSSRGASDRKEGPTLSGQPLDRMSAPADIGPRPIMPPTIADFMRSLLK
jgi:hypothetical protein